MNAAATVSVSVVCAIFAGGGVSALVSWLLFGRESKREHRIWLRERRWECIRAIRENLTSMEWQDMYVMAEMDEYVEAIYRNAQLLYPLVARDEEKVLSDAIDRLVELNREIQREGSVPLDDVVSAEEQLKDVCRFLLSGKRALWQFPEGNDRPVDIHISGDSR